MMCTHHHHHACDGCVAFSITFLWCVHGIISYIPPMASALSRPAARTMSPLPPFHYDLIFIFYFPTHTVVSLGNASRGACKCFSFYAARGVLKGIIGGLFHKKTPPGQKIPGALLSFFPGQGTHTHFAADLSRWNQRCRA